METHIFALFLYKIFAITVITAYSAPGSRQTDPLFEMETRRSLSSSNNGGCPQLPSNCNYDCLSLGQDGCVRCTCNRQGSTGAGSLTGGSTLTSSGAGNQTSTGPGSLTGGGTLSGSGAGNFNLSGGPFFGSGSGGVGGPFGNLTALGNPLQPGGPGSLFGGNGTAGLGNTGMGSLTGGSTLTSSGTNITANSGSLNNFFSGKLNSTLRGNTSFSSTGNIFTMGSVSGNQGNVAQTSMNNNGCPSFPSNCGSTCVTLDSKGCPICTCTISGNNSSSPFSSPQSFGSSVSGQTSASASQNLNGCPAFTNDCSTECVSLNSVGCPICTCHNAGSHSSQSSAHGSSANANGCPKFYSSCPASCVTLNGLGCPICTCNATASGNVTNHFNGGSSYPNSYNRPGSSNAQLANGCPRFPSNCPGSCTTTNDRGCPVCTCSVPAVSPTVAQTECPPTPASCDKACLWEDSESCIRCNNTCDEIMKSSSSPHTSTSSSAGKQTTTNPTTAGVSACPSFDQHCSMSCVSLDSHGCIVCTCPATTKLPISTTITPTPTSTVRTTYSTKICPAFDGSNCRVDCLAMDINGCLICNCGASSSSTVPPLTAPPATGSSSAPPSSSPPVATTSSRSGVTTTLSSGPGSVTTFAPTMPAGSGTVSPNGCPQFDPSCAVECAAVDAVGCLHCSCPKTNTTSTGTGTGSAGPSVGGAGKNNGCPVFDTSCAPGCAVIDAMGCLHCTCTGTTVSSGTGSSGSAGFPGSGSGIFPGSGSTVDSGSGSGGFPGSGSGGFPGSGSGGFPGSGSGGSGSGGFPGSGSGGFPGSGGNPGGNPGSGSGGSCPAVDVMSCQPSCLVYQNGCVLCTCSGTTTPATGVSTQPTRSTVHPVIEITMATSNPLGILPTTTAHHLCPIFNQSCPARCTVVDAGGCPKCECPVTSTTPMSTPVTKTTVPTTPRSNTHAQITTVSRAPQTTTHAPGVCPPIRCLYPCDLGVSLGSDNCPVCKCRANSTTARP